MRWYRGRGASRVHYTAISVSFATLALALRAYAAALLLVATGYALGRRLLSRLPLDGPSERVAMRTAAGIAALGAVLTLLAIAGWLTPHAVLVVAATSHALGWTVRIGSDATNPPSSPSRLLPGFVLAGLAMAPLLALPLFPPLQHDAGMYHLPFIRSLATLHRLAFLPEIRFAAFPQLGEILSVPAYWLAGPAGAQVIHLTFGALTGLLLLAWGRLLLPASMRLVPAATWVGNPLVVFLLGAAYVDLTLSCFVTAGALAWTRWREGRGEAWLPLAGAMLGAAVAVKYLGLVPLFALAAAGVVHSRRRLTPLLRFAAAAIACGGPMVGWITVTTGNPVFPFLPVLFGETPWSWTRHWRGQGADTTVTANVAHTVDMVVAGLKEHLIGAVTVPLRLLSATPLDAESIVSLAFLVALALGCVAVRRDRHLLALQLLVAGYALFWSSLQWPDARLVLPVAPMAAILACVGVAHAAEMLRHRFGQPRSPRFFKVAATLLALPGIAYGWTSLAANGPLPTSVEERMSWLGSRRGEIAAVDLLNRTRPDGYTVYGLYAENARYFAAGRQLGDWVGPHSYHRVIPLLDDPAALAAALCSTGAEYLLVVTRNRPFDAPLRRGFADHFRKRLDAPGVTLYEILDCGPAREGSSS